ncbi:hypothetical protein ACFX10_025186 [Malus domestica]
MAPTHYTSLWMGTTFSTTTTWFMLPALIPVLLATPAGSPRLRGLSKKGKWGNKFSPKPSASSTATPASLAFSYFSHVGL